MHIDDSLLTPSEKNDPIDENRAKCATGAGLANDPTSRCLARGAYFEDYPPLQYKIASVANPTYVHD